VWRGGNSFGRPLSEKEKDREGMKENGENRGGSEERRKRRCHM
jgi:hypothetical protein